LRSRLRKKGTHTQTSTLFLSLFSRFEVTVTFVCERDSTHSKEIKSRQRRTKKMEQPKRDVTERKLVIKSFKVAPKIPSNFLETTWNGRLLHALNAIHDEKPCEESYERLYRAVEDVVVGNFGNELYEKLRQCLEARTEAVAKELKEKCHQGGSFHHGRRRLRRRQGTARVVYRRSRPKKNSF